VFKLPAINSKTHRSNGVDGPAGASGTKGVATERTIQKSIEQESVERQMGKQEIQKEAQRIKDAIGTQRSVKSTISNQNMQLNHQMASSYVDNLFSMFNPAPSKPAHSRSANYQPIPEADSRLETNNNTQGVLSSPDLRDD
jgi:hypothetical protein